MKTIRKDRSQLARKQKSLLQQLAAMPEKLFSGEFRTQYGALCYRWAAEGSDLQVLLITSRGTGRWIIPKGWPMKGKKPHEAAQIEAWEEAGIRGRAKKTPVGRYTYLKWLDDRNVAPCAVEVFQVEVASVDTGYKERGQRALDWVSPEEAARRVREVELKSILINFKPEKRPRISEGQAE